MFGKNSWFANSGTTGRPRPVAWQGYAYLLGWAAVVGAPLLYFLSHRFLAESLVWATASLLGFACDWRSLRRPGAKQALAGDDGIVFLDSPGATNGTPPSQRKYDYYVKG